MTAVSMFLAFCSLIAQLVMLLARLVILTVSLTIQGVVWCCVGIARLLNCRNHVSASR